jgi:hypothetical protein
MAGFEVTLYGRIWVTPEASTANASGLLETALSKVRRPEHPFPHWGILPGALPIRSIVSRS